MLTAYIFDLDGTLATDREFYRSVYSGTLTELIREERGAEGIRMLEYCRKSYQGKGELALFALNIPFNIWAERLIAAPLDLITPNPALVRAIRQISGVKVIYTGSPTQMAERILKRLGFNQNDFAEVVGWEIGELFPMKWSCAPFVFRSLLEKYQCQPGLSWSIGDKWDTDLEPAQRLGIKTALIAERNGSSADVCFASVCDFLNGGVT